MKLNKLKEFIWQINEKKWLKKLRNKNKNINPTIISNNCIGGVIYHNLGLKFTSPTINLFLQVEDYLNFISDIKYYSNCNMVKVETDKEYPVGKLISNDSKHKDIHIYFQHYKTFEEAYSKWKERYLRINYENMYFILEFYDDLYDIELLKKFDKLPLKKIAIVHKPFEDIKNLYTVNCYKEGKPIGKILQHKGILGKRYLDEFDYVSFLNS